MSFFLGSIKNSGCSRRNNGILCKVTQVRNGGGGGRPGGLPVLDWKQKKTLRLSIKAAKKEVKIGAVGNWSDIAHLFDPSRGDTMINWDAAPEYIIKSEEKKEEDTNTRKQVSMPLLFGPNKGFGLLPKRENVNNLRFSHSRVFGVPKKSLYVPEVRGTASVAAISTTEAV